MNVRQQHVVRGAKARAEILQQKSRSAVLVRLEQADQTPRIRGVFQGFQGHAHFGWMMSIVVIHAHVLIATFSLTQKFKSAIDPSE